MKLTAEEEVMSAIIRVYTNNTFCKQINLDEYEYDIDLFLGLIKRCRNGGLIYGMIQSGQIKNFPKEIMGELSAIYKQTIAYNLWLEHHVGEILHKIRSSGASSIMGGSYVILQEICGKYDFSVEELVIYLDKEIDLSQYEGRVMIKKIIKPQKFFDEYYCESKFANILPIEVLYDEVTGALASEKRYGAKHIGAYILRDFYYDRCRLTPFAKKRFSYPILDNIFAERRF